MKKINKIWKNKKSVDGDGDAARAMKHAVFESKKAVDKPTSQFWVNCPMFVFSEEEDDG